jgi:hypothetical protein
MGSLGKRAVGWSSAAIVGALLLGALVRAPLAQESAEAGAESPEALRARLAVLEPRLAYLSDRRDIFEASKRYTRGADRHDKDLVRTAFWPEATISYEKPMKLDEFVTWDEGRLAGYAAHQHHITGQTIEVDGNTAHVESYVITFLVPRDGSADGAGPATPGRAATSEKSLIGSGRFVERWEKRGAEWKIMVREYVEDLTLEGETIDNCGTRTCLGTWDRNDPSYLRPFDTMTAEDRKARGEKGKKPTSPGSGK